MLKGERNWWILLEMKEGTDCQLFAICLLEYAFISEPDLYVATVTLFRVLKVRKH